LDGRGAGLREKARVCTDSEDCIWVCFFLFGWRHCERWIGVRSHTPGTPCLAGDLFYISLQGRFLFYAVGWAVVGTRTNNHRDIHITGGNLLHQLMFLSGSSIAPIIET
jgi:hypothetical protein